MKRVVIIISIIMVILAIGATYLITKAYFDQFEIIKKDGEVQKAKDKVKEIEDKTHKIEEEINKIQEENQAAIGRLEVWQKELEKVKS